jgi:hypothetical protein
MISDVVFTRRENPDLSLDSICMTCYLTVGTVTTKRELERLEQEHECERSIMKECDRFRRYEDSQRGTF